MKRIQRILNLGLALFLIFGLAAIFGAANLWFKLQRFLRGFKMSSKIKLHSKMTDDEIRATVLEYPDGRHVKEICRQCFTYYTGPEYRTVNCKILDSCGDCLTGDELEGFDYLDDEDRFMKETETYWNNIEKRY